MIRLRISWASRSGRADHTHAAMPAMSGQAKLVPLPYGKLPFVCRKNRGKAQKSRKRVCEFGKFIVPLQTNLKKAFICACFGTLGNLETFFIIQNMKAISVLVVCLYRCTHVYGFGISGVGVHCLFL